MSGGLNLSALALRHRALTLFAMIAVAAGGIMAYLQLGRAEDPNFTIKNMVILVDWPGAAPDEMARLVVDPIERKLEDLAHLDTTESQTQAGHATITITLRDDTPPALVQGLWYQVRKKIADLQPSLPQGIQGPYFNDEFGDTYSLVYALTGEGFTLPELKHVAEDVREQLVGLPGVGKVILIGQQDERISIEVSARKLAELGLTLPQLYAVVQRENAVVDSGFVDTAQDRIRVRTSPSVDGPQALMALPIPAQGRLLRLGDFATIRRITADPPSSTMRVGGKPALGIGISMAEGGNVLDLGQAIATRLDAIRPSLPLGIQLTRLNDQSRVVANDIADFQESFIEALAIVLLVSFVSLGWRTGLVVAISVPLVIAGVFIGMKLLGIDLQRISLGAMIIALGLLVDDAIIAVETMTVKLEQGWDRIRAGSFAYTSTAFPMLTGTLVTAAGYLPVGLAQSSTGEYTRDIFRVVGLALVLSWLVAVFFVPYLGAALLPEPKHHASEGEMGAGMYHSPLYRRFRAVVAWCVQRRFVVIAATILAFITTGIGFTRVPNQFFPASDRLEILIDVRLPEGASFAATQDAVSRLEKMLQTEPGIDSFAAYTGTGTPRFFLAFSPELDQPNYAQFVINMKTIPDRERLLARLNTEIDRGITGAFPDIRLRASRLELGPPVGYPVQFRVVGPDALRLRQIGAEIAAAMATAPDLRNISTSWGALAKRVQIDVDQDKARLLGIASADIATTLATLQQGSVITTYREGTDLIPVIGRAIPAERRDLAAIADVPIPVLAGGTVPLGQIATITAGLEQPIVYRRNRTPMLLVRGDTQPGIQAPVATAQVLPLLDPIKARLPQGYRIDTAGAVYESAKGQVSINAQMPVMIFAMLTLLMLQLQSFSRMAMVLLTAPLGLIGVSAALLATGAPFGFVAMLGFIALAGIIMRNSVILVDQIEQDIAAGHTRFEAIVEATVRRSRPIVLTALAAILALVPLAFSVFWGPMAIASMGGLISATLLTFCFVPALYAAWSRVPRSRMHETVSIPAAPATQPGE